MKKSIIIVGLSIILTGCSLLPFNQFEPTMVIDPSALIGPSHTFNKIQINRLFKSEEVFTINSEMELALLLFKQVEQEVYQLSYVSDSEISLQRVYLYLESLIVQPFSLKQGTMEYRQGNKVTMTTQYIELVIDNEKNNELMIEANSIIQLIINDEMSDWRKIEAIHDYLVKTVAYDISVLDLDLSKVQSHPSFQAYGALVLQTAVCSGYSKAFLLLARLADIQSMVVTSQIIQHAWNIVFLDDEIYYLDTTWNDPIPDVPNRVLRTYFMNKRRQFLADGKHIFDKSSLTTLDAQEFEWFADYVFNPPFQNFGN